MKVLIVEDDRSIQMVLELVLSRMAKCEVITAADGKEGLDKLKLHKPDVVLLDLMLPTMDGFEICQSAKADDSTRHIPIIFLTAQPQPSSITRAMSLGAIGYIIKPFDPLTLLNQINEALDKVQAPRLG